MYKSTVSVRAYHFMKNKMGYTFPFSPAECEYAATHIVLGFSPHVAGLTTAVELYRAAGYGVWQIWYLVNDKMDFSRVKKLCEKFDKELHQAL